MWCCILLALVGSFDNLGSPFIFTCCGFGIDDGLYLSSNGRAMMDIVVDVYDSCLYLRWEDGCWVG